MQLFQNPIKHPSHEPGCRFQAFGLGRGGGAFGAGGRWSLRTFLGGGGGGGGGVLLMRFPFCYYNVNLTMAYAITARAAAETRKMLLRYILLALLSLLIDITVVQSM